MTPEEQTKVRWYIEEGWRDLQLADIRRSNECDVRMGTFAQCAAFLDTLALAYTGGLRVKRKKEGQWDAFVGRFFEGATRDALLGKYEGFRCALLHNFSASGLAFTHDHADDHLRVANGLTILNRESFVAEVESAFQAFYAAVLDDDELRGRVLAWLDDHPPIGVWLLEDEVRGDLSDDPPRQVSQPPPGHFPEFAANAISASAAGSVTGTRVSISEFYEQAQARPHPPTPQPKLAPSLKTGKKRRKRNK